MQISSVLTNPVCPHPLPVVLSQSLPGRDHSFWGESVQGNKPAGNYLLVWDVYCCRSSLNQLPAEGGQVPPGRGWGCSGRTCVKGGIPGDARPGGLRIQKMSHIWRGLFLSHIPYPMQACNETFHVLAPSILFPCRTNTRGAFLALIAQLFANISRGPLI